jgi:NitT/TauT family transport system ATP-binding protein
VKGPRSTVGMAFQNPVLLEWRTILKNVLLPLEIVPTKLSKREAEDRARFLLALVGLEGFEDKRPSELSGGMRQRASLCRALIHQPDVLILDEPFGALDAFTREDLWQTMHKVKEREPFTGVLITHDLRESIFLADQVVVLSGRPARTQYVLDVPSTGPRTLDDLYTPQRQSSSISCATRSRSRKAAPNPRIKPHDGSETLARHWRALIASGRFPAVLGMAGLGQWLAQIQDGRAL